MRLILDVLWYIGQWTGSFVHAMAWCLFETKPFPKPMLILLPVDHLVTIGFYIPDIQECFYVKFSLKVLFARCRQFWSGVSVLKATSCAYRTSYPGYFRVSHWLSMGLPEICRVHDDVIKWKHFPRYWPFVRGIHRPPVNSPHKGQWRGALMFFYLRLNKQLSKQSTR